MSHYAEEHYAVYDERARKARKAHVCCACKEEIPPGAVYTRVFILFDHEKETVKRCARCQLMHEHLRGLGDDTWPAEKLDCGQSYEGEWDVAPPDWLQALAFWRPGDPLPALNPCASLRAWGRTDVCWGQPRYSGQLLHRSVFTVITHTELCS